MTKSDFEPRPVSLVVPLRDQSVEIIRLERSQRRTAIVTPTAFAFREAVGHFVADPDVRAVVPCGVGGIFRAGKDLSAFAAGDLPGHDHERSLAPFGSTAQEEGDHRRQERTDRPVRGEAGPDRGGRRVDPSPADAHSAATASRRVMETAMTEGVSEGEGRRAIRTWSRMEESTDAREGASAFKEKRAPISHDA